MHFILDPWRWLAAGLLLLGYGAFCLRIAYLQHARQRPGRQTTASGKDWLIVYASQTGNGMQLAQQTQSQLAAAGLAASVLCISRLAQATLQQAQRVLFIVSTYGEGDAPDTAAHFVGHQMTRTLPAATLAQLQYAVLALGDSSYQHFCGFGRKLDAWLHAAGARALMPRLDMDRGNADTWQHWLQQLAGLSGSTPINIEAEPPMQNWLICQRQLLNPGSAGAPLYEICLRPENGSMPDWQAGDLVQIAPPASPEAQAAREYSIASLPHEGKLRLLVRLHQRPDQSHGLVSGWLCLHAASEAAGVAAQPIALKIRPHPAFQLQDNAHRPLILIGNGSGLAGLRAHLKSRIDAGVTQNWLIYGERNRQHDFHWQQELLAWQQQQALQLYLAFSRDQEQLCYVQHVLLQQTAQVQAWVKAGAAIYVCGSLQGMAAGVQVALQQILGETALEQLRLEGRYRRDVY